MADVQPFERRKSRELWAFLFLTVVFWPLLAIAVVGGYGLAVWLFQLVSGPPAG
ncbi:periplasmic nitrate reductase, NapE protein [Azospirillum sp. sgz301742]